MNRVSYISAPVLSILLNELRKTDKIRGLPNNCLFFKNNLINSTIQCHRASYRIHFCCLAVEAGFYSDMEDCVPVEPATQVDPWLRQVAVFHSTTGA